MRVVAGELRGRHLEAPEGLQTRPTSDKVRQAVFNSLDSAGFIDGATVADLFAGSGAMGIEALSRGAESCVFVEKDRTALAVLRRNLASLGLGERSKVVVADVMTALAQCGTVDLAIVDPPYEFAGWPELFAAVGAATVVAESDREISPAEGWHTIRARRYGRTFVTILGRIV